MLLVALFLSYFAILFLEFRRKSLAIILWAGLFVFFMLPHTIDAMLGTREYLESTYVKASVFALCFNLIYFFTRFVFSVPIAHLEKLDSNRDIFERVTKDSIPNIDRLFIGTLFISLVLSFLLLLFFIITHIDNLMSSTWVDMFNNRGGFSYLMFSYLFPISLPVLFLSYKYRMRKKFIISLLITLFVVLVFRVRSYMIPAILPFIVFYIFRNRFKLNLRNILITLLLAISLLYVIFGIGVFRIYGSLNNFFANVTFSDFNKTMYGLLFSRYSELGLRNAFYLFLEKGNNFPNFGTGQGYLRLLMLPIPSSWSFGLKPQDFAMDMAMAYDPVNSVPGVNSMHPTLYGDSYANFGWAGVGLGVFWSLFATLSDLLTRNTREGHGCIVKTSMLVSFSYAFTLIARGAVYYGVINAVLIFVFHSALWMLLKDRRHYFAVSRQ